METEKKDRDSAQKSIQLNILYKIFPNIQRGGPDFMKSKQSPFAKVFSVKARGPASLSIFLSLEAGQAG